MAASGICWGTFELHENANHRIELTDHANGTVIADALKFVPSTMTRVATWTPTIATTDDYDVYAKWPASPGHATNATYTVHHASGSTPVSVNQQEKGGQWNLLGTFSMSPGANHRVELSDQANGLVVADAVYVVPHSATPTQVTWTPTLTAPETLEVFAKWTADADRADSVTYTVHHDGGSTPIVVNQRQNGGTWNLLGQFTMSPASNHRVVVTDNSTGVVVADAVRFVSAGGATSTGLFYVHADHLGTPQKMTDGTKTLVWDAVYKPFGEQHSITGTGSNNQRFPGQYFDGETGYHQNYFRDYDPTTGRYVQADPLGLIPGLPNFLIERPTRDNTIDISLIASDPNSNATEEQTGNLLQNDMHLYSYVRGNPLVLIDPTGLLSSCPGDGVSLSLALTVGSGKPLKRCLNACAAGGKVLDAFCRSLPEPRLRAGCWGLQFVGVAACRGWCFMQFS